MVIIFAVGWREQGRDIGRVEPKSAKLDVSGLTATKELQLQFLNI